MRRKVLALTISLLVLVMAIPSYAGQARILSDEELDQVSAKGLNIDIDYDYHFYEGSVNLSDLIQQGYNVFNLSNGNTVFTLAGNAQQNLQALINVNAVNSPVICQLNITIVNGPNFGTISPVNNGQIITNLVL